MLLVWQVLLRWMRGLAQAGLRLMLPQLALPGNLRVQLERCRGKLGRSLAELREALALLAALALSACCLGWQQALVSPQEQRLHLPRQVGRLLDSLRRLPAGVTLPRAQKPEVKLQARLWEAASWVELTREQKPAGKLQEQLPVALQVARWAVQPVMHSVMLSISYSTHTGSLTQGLRLGLPCCVEVPHSASWRAGKEGPQGAEPSHHVCAIHSTRKTLDSSWSAGRHGATARLTNDHADKLTPALQVRAVYSRASDTCYSTAHICRGELRTGTGGTEEAATLGPGPGAAIGAIVAWVVAAMRATRLEADDHTLVCPSAPPAGLTGACPRLANTGTVTGACAGSCMGRGHP